MKIIGSLRSIIGCTKEHNRQSLGEYGNSIIGKFKSTFCQGLSESLTAFFTAILRHGKCLRDCVLVPIRKGGRDASSSENYRPIALASSISILLEHIIFDKYSSFLYSHPLQFGFKAGSSTTLCTGLYSKKCCFKVCAQWVFCFWMQAKLLIWLTIANVFRN